MAIKPSGHHRQRRNVRIGAVIITVLLASLCLLNADAMALDAAEASSTANPGGIGTISDIPGIWWIAPIGSIVALIWAFIFYKSVMAADEGDENMKEIAAHVRAGAYAYLRRQYKVVALVFIVLCAILAFMAFGLHVQHKIVPIAFLTGGFFSGLCGFLGMKTATNAAHRTTAGARESLNRGLVVAFRAGAVMGLVVVGFALLDITGWFILLKLWGKSMSVHNLTEITVVMLTFGMGASTQALFARVGGGIYTKAADVGADLIGKVEAGIPEDDPRNPAAIADNVGDNVGDVAGMGADLYESYAGSILATAALGVAAGVALFSGGSEAEAYNASLKFLAAPMTLAGIGIILSIIGIYMVRTHEEANMGQLMSSLLRGVNGSSLLIAIAAGVVCYVLLGDIETPSGYVVRWWGVWISIVTGLGAGIIIGYMTEYYTSYEYKPTKDIAQQAETGPATVIIAGVAEGMKSTWASLLTIIVAIMVAFVAAGGGHELMLGLYGVGIAAVGMLATLGITLATDAYGPIADNAGGNAEMTHQKPEVRQRTDALDSLGNTTAATGKGFAIGSAALTALALLAAYVEEVRVGQVREAHAYVQSHPNLKQGQLAYIGYRKFAMKTDDSGLETGTTSWMLLSKHGADQLKAGSLLPNPIPAAANQEGVKSVTYEDQTYQLVNSQSASLPQFMYYYNVTLMNPKVLCGLFSGVLLAFLFCALTMKAVGRAAYQMMMECRSQFAKIRGALKAQGKTDAEVADPDNWPDYVMVGDQRYPDYANCVAISTKGAQKEMVLPSLLAIATPVVVGLILGVPGVMGLLAGGLTSGFAVAVFMANAGGAWDNAKKYIETGQHGGKGSDAHKAGVVGDTVGDPFKDTSGPSLNILIKLMSMVSVVFAGLIVKFAPMISGLLGLGN